MLGHRREKLRLEQTPLWTVLQLESELALMQRTALRAFLLMGLRCERMVARNLFGMIDVNTDSLLQVVIPPPPVPRTRTTCLYTPI